MDPAAVPTPVNKETARWRCHRSRRARAQLMHRLAEDEFRRSRIDAEDPAAQREAIVDTLRVLDLRSAAGRAKGNFIGLGRGRRGR